MAEDITDFLERGARSIGEWQEDGELDPGIEVAILAFGLVAQIKAHFQARAIEFGLSVAECELLLMLKDCEPMTMRKVAEKKGMDPSNLTNLVSRMEARGLVAREPTPADRRAKAVNVTPAGADVADRLMARLEAGNPASAGLDEDEVVALRGVLRRLVSAPLPAA
jgi:DNA-binding MarR family transcriptional regulator